MREQVPHSIEIIRLLLRHGADPDQEDDYGNTPRLKAGLAIFSHRFSPDYRAALADLFPLSGCIDVLELSYAHKVVLSVLPVELGPALRQLLPADYRPSVSSTPRTGSA